MEEPVMLENLPVVFALLLEIIQLLEHLGYLPFWKVSPHPSWGGHRIVNPIARYHLQHVKDVLPVPPRVHEEGVQPNLITSNPEEQEMGMDIGGTRLRLRIRVSPVAAYDSIPPQRLESQDRLPQTTSRHTAEIAP